VDLTQKNPTKKESITTKAVTRKWGRIKLEDTKRIKRRSEMGTKIVTRTQKKRLTFTPERIKKTTKAGGKVRALSS